MTLQAAEAHEPEHDESPHYEATDYPWIRAWGRLCGFDQHTVEAQLALARTEAAPETATAKVDTPGWMTLIDIWPEAYESRIWMVDWAESRGLSIPASVLRVWLDPHALMRTWDQG